MHLPLPSEHVVHQLQALGRLLRDAVIAARSADAAFAGVSRHTVADTIYQLDTHVEPVLEHFCAAWASQIPGGIVLVAEGVEGPGGAEGITTFPPGTDPEKAAIRLIVDPIDGTRGLMYDKRAAWVLMGVAANRGATTRLSDIEVAVQVEMPTSRQGASDVLWATKGGGAFGQREWRNSEGDGRKVHWSPPRTFALRASTATTLAHGFASVVNFFPGTKILASELMERIVLATIGPADVNKALVFDDQYISTGGQFYELMAGHDRFTADLRPLFYRILGQPAGLCAHPYDVSTMLIAREAGVIITDGLGGELDGPLDVETPLPWAGYANAAIRDQVEPAIVRWMMERGLGGMVK